MRFIFACLFCARAENRTGCQYAVVCAMEHGILGIRRRNQPVYPREEMKLGMERVKREEIPKVRKTFWAYRVEKMGEIPKVRENFGHRGEKMEEIPKTRKHFGHRGEKMEEIPKARKNFGHREEKWKKIPKGKSLHRTLDNTVDKKCLERR